MKGQVSLKRWQIAQESEKEYWSNFDEKTLFEEEIIMHKKKAEILKNEWKNFLEITPKTKILQIGCGPEDVVMHLKIGKRYAIDPLADFYKKKFNLDYRNLKFFQGRGEELPFKNNSFDLVILANVLDHVESPEKVLSEIKRVLKSNGIFYFEDPFYQKNFIRIATFWGSVKRIFTGQIFNIHHPFMFALEDIKRIISKEFSIIHEDIARDITYYENINELRQKKLQEKKFTIRIPAIFGLYGTINYIAICNKKKL